MEEFWCFFHPTLFFVNVNAHGIQTALDGIEEHGGLKMMEPKQGGLQYGIV